MPNPIAPNEGSGRRIPFLVDPNNTGVAFLQAGEGAFVMGGGMDDAAAAYVLTAPATDATRTAVASAESDTHLVAATSVRRGLTVFNDSSAILYLCLGTATASTTDYTVQVPAGGYYEAPDRFTGEVRGIWASADGFAYITELVP